MRVVLLLVLLFAALLMVKTSSAYAQGICPDQYGVCMNGCAGLRSSQERCMQGCQGKNNLCAARYWGASKSPADAHAQADTAAEAAVESIRPVAPRPAGSPRLGANR